MDGRMNACTDNTGYMYSMDTPLHCAFFLSSSINAMATLCCEALTFTAGSNWRTFLALLQSIPASILGSIISIADMASNSPNLKGGINT